MEDIKNKNRDELEYEIKKAGFEKYRARQVFDWIHKKNVDDVMLMKNLPNSLKDFLDKNYIIKLPTILEKLESKKDGTKKYLLELSDNKVIEAVLMKYEYGLTICISTQVGCKMGCKFCASTLLGFERNLSSAEMLGEIYAIQNDNKERINHIVLMGIGEPLDNYDNVISFIRMIISKESYNISARNITISTCGIIPNMRKLKGENLPITLALSLHAGSNTKRKEIMPITNKYKLEDVLAECMEYYKVTKRRVTYEYALIRGQNDTSKNALELVSLIKKYPAHLNLILINEVKETNLNKPDKNQVNNFINILKDNNINVTLRRSLGDDIEAACGQLRAKYIKG